MLIVGIADPPGVEEHTRSMLNAVGTWVGGHRMRNFTFDAAELPSAYDDWTLARPRRATRTYDPLGDIAVGRALAS